jgi:hypothetical protein
MYRMGSQPLMLSSDQPVLQSKFLHHTPKVTSINNRTGDGLESTYFSSPSRLMQFSAGTIRGN